MCDLSGSLNESPIITWKAHKISYIFYIPWSRSIHNGINLFMVYKYTLIQDNVTQIVNPIFILVTLAKLCIQLMLPKQLQCQSQTFFMLFFILRINNNFIKEYKNKLV